MAFFYVTTPLRSAKDRNISFAFDAPYPNIDELHRAFTRDGVVKGVRYGVMSDRAEDIYRLVDPRPTLLSRYGFVTISLFQGIEKFQIERER